MLLSTVRNNVKRRILETVRSDPRIVGCVDYGSVSENREDEWSDIDLALFIRDSDLDLFEKNWKQWVLQFGNLLLAYIGGIGHPWVVYDTDPMPLRVDFAFHPASTIGRILQWPNSPYSTEAMVLYDGTDGQLTDHVKKIVRQSLAPDNLMRTFEQVCGDFWYYLIRTQTKLIRGEQWATRHDFNFIIVGNLLALLRIECGAISQWRGSSASIKIEEVLTEQRLWQLNQCIPEPNVAGLKKAMLRSASLGYEVCEQIA